MSESSPYWSGLCRLLNKHAPPFNVTGKFNPATVRMAYDLPRETIDQVGEDAHSALGTILNGLESIGKLMTTEEAVGELSSADLARLGDLLAMLAEVGHALHEHEAWSRDGESSAEPGGANG